MSDPIAAQPHERARTVVITGASDGIGAAASEQLASAGDRIVVIGRSPEKTRAVARRIGAEHHVADFARLSEVRELASTLLAECEHIDVLANNAGGLFSGPIRTDDGFERTFQVNHLAPVLLTNLLLDRLIASRASVVNTSSAAARLFGHVDLDDLDGWKGFSPNRAYGNAKLANVLFAKGLHERFHAQGLSAVAFHPGVVATSFASDTTSPLRRLYFGALRRFLTSPEGGGAALSYFIAGAPGEAWQSGEYYRSPGRIGRTNPQASDPELVRSHWEQSARMLGITW
ncbi:SDR family NAD(P)-dependent oxidoreductase [Agrococcus sp. ARC_14]|uniref:SDR family NAD(P)-dependent oxidoreductase n=1 Tax=Agrococcus sp. ARC_14 TaxID=2919927 RepID=UPI001F05E68D|nr:SDR family NAD(P)-dependent oxidoreductase [Agrococcus sp. ARC_14]MCH1883276.1 SDR family NAD(P)-dependent oxidoreductase [Agrococcus sp. ARC_14]